MDKIWEPHWVYIAALEHIAQGNNNSSADPDMGLEQPLLFGPPSAPGQGLVLPLPGQPLLLLRPVLGPGHPLTCQCQGLATDALHHASWVLTWFKWPPQGTSCAAL